MGMNMSYLLDSPALKDIQNALNLIALGNVTDINDWDDIARIVRNGLGAKAFPIGTQLSVSRGENVTPYVFDVVDHRTVTDAATGDSKPGMALLLHRVIYDRAFDAVEALFYCESALPAGTYHFTIPNYDATYGGNKTYQFTLTSQVPAKGQIVFNWGYNQQVTAGNIKTYSSATSTEAIETATLSEGTGGTDLGTADGTTTNMNHIQRARYGSNNYKESAIRQWINANGAAGSWWAASNKFDRPVGYAASAAGFLNGVDSKFLNAVRATNIPCKTNNTFELTGWTLNTAYTVQDKFFLASRNELGYGTENVAEGSVFKLYDGATNADRIKYDFSSTAAARYWWMRSPYPGNAGYVRRVLTDGSLNFNNAFTGLGAVPACIIC